MEEFFKVVGSGFAGAVLTAIVAVAFYRKKNSPPTGRAYQALMKLDRKLQDPEGEYHFTPTSDSIFHLVKDLYSISDGEVIATAFHEDPAKYGKSDLVRGFRSCESFTRITSEEICKKQSQEAARESLEAVKKGSTFVVIPRGEAYTRIDGIFCRFRDGTHLSFMSFQDPENPTLNKGVIFRDGIAQYFFDYYFKIARHYES